jgi:hypothetical protein
VRGNVEERRGGRAALWKIGVVEERRGGRAALWKSGASAPRKAFSPSAGFSPGWSILHPQRAFPQAVEPLREPQPDDVLTATWKTAEGQSENEQATERRKKATTPPHPPRKLKLSGSDRAQP